MATKTLDKNVLHSLEREKAICELAIHNLQAKCHDFENKYEMPTDEFLTKFDNGVAGDEEDFFEWYALAQGLIDWQEQQSSLSKIVP